MSLSATQLRYILMVLLTLLLTACRFLEIPGLGHKDHLALGNPSQATADVANYDNFLLTKPQYVLSYNRTLGRLNWASWQLNRNWLGAEDRQNDFRPDPALPSNWPEITPNDYRRSGYDRGHIVPSGDRTLTVEDNSATFLMSNILPQSPDNNQGPWVDLEKYARKLVEEGKSLYIIAGGYGEQKAIAKGKIVPPKQLWKVIVVLDRTADRPQDISTTTPVIAVDLPNTPGIREDDWRDYLVSVDEIESSTGYDLLSNVAKSIQNQLESQKTLVQASLVPDSKY